MRLHHLLPHVILLASPATPYTPLPAYDEIRQTLNTYPLAVDFKNAPLFDAVFTPDAFANYTGPLSNLTGLTAVREALLASVAGLATQHQLGTTLIDIAGDGQANSTTYFTANLVSVVPETAGDFTVLFGLYRDELVETDAGWRISKRQLEFMTPNLGNLTLG
jgi:hypothetical protein